MTALSLCQTGNEEGQTEVPQSTKEEAEMDRTHAQELKKQIP